MRIALAAFALLTLASAAAAQARPSPACRAVAAVDHVTIGLERALFFDDDEEGDSAYTQLRAHFGIRKLAPSEPVVPIRDVAVCEAWLPALLAAIRTIHPAASSTNGYLFEMIQYGPYMLVVGGIDPDTVQPGVSVAGYRRDVFVFEAAGRRFLGAALH
jgi:hypothetical protein